MGLFRKKQDPISARQKQLNAEIAALEAQIQQLSLEKEQEPEQEQEQALAAPFSGAPVAKSKGSPFAAPAAPAELASTSGSGANHSRPNGNSSSTPSPPTQLRLRSTAVPHGSLLPTAGQPLPTTAPASSANPIFEEVDQDRLQAQPEEVVPGHYNDLGVRKYDLASGWRRLKNHFRGPVTSNPKLVHYLSAGSIQGLRPLRYEKRVARNRVIVLAAFLVLALWGVIAIFFSKH
jgi:hypothetical protein